MTTKVEAPKGLIARKEWGYDVQFREAKSEDDYRRVEVLAVPWGVIDSRGYGKERFQKNAFNEYFRDRGKASVALELGHWGPHIGVSEKIKSIDAGLEITFKVADTRDGVDAMKLIDGVFMRAVSPGFYAHDSKMQDGVVVYKQVSLFHVALVHSGSYPTAGVTGTRNEGNSTPRRDAWGKILERRLEREELLCQL